jgi:hypothetical protein
MKLNIKKLFKNKKDQAMNESDGLISPPITEAEYKKSLAELSREKLIKRLVDGGISEAEATEFADEVDKDRPQAA